MAYVLSSTLYFPLLWLRFPIIVVLRILSGLSLISAVMLAISWMFGKGSFPGWPSIASAVASFTLFAVAYAYDWVLLRLNVVRLSRKVD